MKKKPEVVGQTCPTFTVRAFPVVFVKKMNMVIQSDKYPSSEVEEFSGHH
jgi:hypothetical protein